MYAAACGRQLSKRSDGQSERVTVRVMVRVRGGRHKDNSEGDDNAAREMCDQEGDSEGKMWTPRGKNEGESDQYVARGGRRW